MSIVAAVLGIVDGVTLLVSATKRLVKAAEASEPPASDALVPPPPLGSGYPEAVAYLRGGNDEAARREEQERLGRAFQDFARKAASADGGDAAESETPTEGS